MNVESQDHAFTGGSARRGAPQKATRNLDYDQDAGTPSGKKTSGGKTQLKLSTKSPLRFPA